MFNTTVKYWNQKKKKKVPRNPSRKPKKDVREDKKKKYKSLKMSIRTFFPATKFKEKTNLAKTLLGVVLGMADFLKY